ncbi:HAD superfamily hydrolase (TIGR01490 family) [Streptomyces sp. SAI-144]|uniref:HAD family hydrolase n=1 Tax=Streptomyces sp. SAI-144 TaxID=2940544 RepID=UPI002473B5B0|nr:HAD-IB family hydrolase [Streptomyces sp. SAI-144]MDH6437035.1 HAD superfamily hydrolase (TIGR01490 family) [Streptomyces sp. SAI-144]
MTPADHRPAAFFDVDNTLTRGTALFRFLAYWYAVQGRPPHEAVRERQRLKAMTTAGADRAETNRAYFRLLTGAPAAEITRAAESWFRAELARGGFFHEPVLEALHTRRRDGHQVVLVSGSFPALLLPVLEHIGAHHLLCTEPEITPVSRTYTGRLADRPHQPMIGRAKSEAVRELAAAHRIDLDSSIAYGDHISDAPLLSLTGRAVIVGDDQELRRLAAHHGWDRLPKAPAPPAVPLPEPNTVPPGAML